MSISSLAASPPDSNNRKVSNSSGFNSAIKAGSLNSPATTPLTLSLSAPGIKSVGEISLILKATTKGNESLNKNQYMQFNNITAALPNGITINK